MQQWHGAREMSSGKFALKETELWKELATAGRRMTHSTEVARHRRYNYKRYNQNNMVQETDRCFRRDAGWAQNATMA
jgi:hypothetical protein